MQLARNKLNIKIVIQTIIILLICMALYLKPDNPISQGLKNRFVQISCVCIIIIIAYIDVSIAIILTCMFIVSLIPVSITHCRENDAKDNNKTTYTHVIN